MFGSGTSDPVVFALAMLFALTGGDWALGIAKYRREQRASAKVEREQAETRFRTVAADEAESAVRVMGEALNRVNADNAMLRQDVSQVRADNEQLRKDVVRLRKDLDDCLEAVGEYHAPEGDDE
jgi:uncharacterized coiled-coil DUF342 family protein